MDGLQSIILNLQNVQIGSDEGIMIISVYDNYLYDPELKADWGFSTLIKTPSETILFDTGRDSEILLFNMEKLNINPMSIGKVVISHIHDDHLGGLEGFLDKNNDVTVYVPFSFPIFVKNMITEKGSKCIEVSEFMEISELVYTTGELTGDPDEQALVIESLRGLVVVTGCAHPGIVGMIERVRILFENKKVYLVVGGFHNPNIECVDRFRELGVVKVAPSHCTGDLIRDAFRDEYGENFIEYGVGKMLTISYY